MHDYNTAPRFAVPAAGTVDVDVTVPRGAHLVGTLTDRFTGAPVAGVNVFAHPAAASHSAAGRSDDLGRFDIGRLPPDRFRIQYDAAVVGYRSVHWHEAVPQSEATLVEVPRAGRVTVDHLLDRGATVSGTVTDAAGSGIAGVQVTITRDGGCCVQAGPLRTAADGTWAATGVNPGDYRVRYETHAIRTFVGEWWPNRLTRDSAGLLRVTTDATAVADAVLDRGGRITGRAVMTDGSVPAQACVAAIDSTGTPLLSSSAGGSVAGGWEVSGLRPGRYALSYRDCNHGDGAVIADRFSGSGASRDTARHVDVVAAGTTTLPQDILEFAGTVTGTVRTWDGQAVPWGTIIELSRSGHRTQTHYVEGSGSYTVHGLAPGTWQVRALTCGSPRYAPSTTLPTPVVSGSTTTAPDTEIGPRTSSSCPVPPAPTGVAIKAGPGSVSVRWVPPTRDVPAPAEAFEVTLHPLGRTQYVSEYDSDGAIFAGLSPQTPVYATVRSRHPLYGEVSAPSATVTPEPGPEAEPARPETAAGAPQEPAPSPAVSPSPSATPSPSPNEPPSPSATSSPGVPPSPSAEPSPVPGGPAPSSEPSPTMQVMDGGLRPLPPSRVLDTRDGTGGVSGRLPNGQPISVRVTGRGGGPRPECEPFC